MLNSNKLKEINETIAKANQLGIANPAKVRDLKMIIRYNELRYGKQKMSYNDTLRIIEKEFFIAQTTAASVISRKKFLWDKLKDITA